MNGILEWDNLKKFKIIELHFFDWVKAVILNHYKYFGNHKHLIEEYNILIFLFFVNRDLKYIIFFSLSCRLFLRRMRKAEQ